jgi:hypothetical protein
MGGWTSAIAKQYNLGKLSMLGWAGMITDCSQGQLCVGKGLTLIPLINSKYI